MTQRHCKALEGAFKSFIADGMLINVCVCVCIVFVFWFDLVISVLAVVETILPFCHGSLVFVTHFFLLTASLQILHYFQINSRPIFKTLFVPVLSSV